MLRYFIEISYDGTQYHGWQIQSNAITIQEIITDRIRTYLSDDQIDIVGCGRTDTGVHAKQFFLHFDCNDSFEFDKAIYNLNNMLPNDIVIHKLFRVENDLHARFSAVKRTYKYYLHRLKDPFKEKYSLYYNKELDVERMNQACKILLKHNDFTSFSKVHTDVKTNICNLSEAKWITLNNELIFTISADRFLRNMVRSIVGTMIEIGLKKLEVKEINSIIETKDRAAAGVSVSAHGLFLEEVKYDNSK